MKVTRKAERGNALVFAMLVITILGGASAAMLSVSIGRSRESAMSIDDTRSYYIAEAGVSASIADLMAKADEEDPDIGDVSGYFDKGYYIVEAEEIEIDVWRITSSGTYGDYSTQVEVVVVRSESSPFTKAAFGDDGLSMTGNGFCDSYDSDTGTYAEQVSGRHAGENGNIGANAEISLGPNTEVWGDATPGPDHSVSGSGSVSGSTAPAEEEYPVQSYTYSPAGQDLGTLNSSTTLSSGAYRYSSIALAGHDVLTLGAGYSDEVILYVDGSISVSGKAQIIIPDGVKVTLHHGGVTQYNCLAPFSGDFLMPMGPSNKYLTVLIQGGGSVEKNPSMPSYPHNTDVTLTASAHGGWRFDHWEDDLSGSSTTGTVTMNQDRFVTAVFVPVPEGYTLTVNRSGTGSVTKNPDKTLYDAGEAVSLTASAGSGWAFDRWEGDLAGSSNPASLAMNGARSVTAVFIEQEEEEDPEDVDGTGIKICGNGIANNSHKAGNMIIYSAGAYVKIAGNGDCHAAIHAPNALAKFVGNADFYGSVVGKIVRVTGNGNIHYDEALARLDLDARPRYEIRFWRASR